MTEQPVYEESSGNVFADLGLKYAEELFTRGKIGIQVLCLLQHRNLKQREISELLGIPQPEVSHLMKGEFQRFSEGKLLTFLKRLDTEVTWHLPSPLSCGKPGWGNGGMAVVGFVRAHR